MKKVFKYSMKNISKVQKKLPKFAEGIFFNLNRNKYDRRNIRAKQ